MDSETFLKGEAPSPRDRNVFLIYHQVQITIRSRLKSKVNLSATVFVDNSFASQHRKHWLVRYFGSANFLSYGTNHQLLLKKQQQQNKQLLSLHFISLCESPLDNFLCVGSGSQASSCSPLADSKKHKILRKEFKYWRTSNSAHFAVPLVVVETSHRSQHPV